MAEKRSLVRGGITLAVLAALAGATLVAPAGAHVTGKFAHLKKHMRQVATKVFNQKIGSASVANATNADNLDNIDSTAFLQSQGALTFSASHKDWVAQSGIALDEDYFRNNAFFQSAGAGNAFIGTGPSLPVGLYGRSTQVVGVRFCYDNSASTTIDNVFLTVYSTTNGGFPVQKAVFTDPTNRTDDACRTYNLPAPTTLASSDFVEFSAEVIYAAATNFTVTGTTFFLSASTSAAARVGADRGGVTLSPSGSSEGES